MPTRVSKSVSRAIVTALLPLGLVGVLGGGVASAKPSDNHGSGASARDGNVGGVSAGHGHKGGNTTGGAGEPDSIGVGTTVSGGQDGPDVGGSRGAPGGSPTKSGPLSPSGTTTCSVNVVLRFKPPLQAAAGTSSSVTINAQLTRCSVVAGHGRTTGHVSGAIGDIPSSACASSTMALPAIPSPGLTMRWTPPSRAKSTVTGPAGTASTVTDSHGKTELQVAYTGITVTGSFATTTGTMVIASDAPASSLSRACSGSGLGAISFKGTATL